jgi:aminotransferase
MIGVFGARTGAEEVEAAGASIAAGWMGLGPQVARFEAALAGRAGQDVVLVDSGSSALHAALVALDLPPGCEVVLPSMTYVACANAVVLAGHRPVFCDVDVETANVDASVIERVLGPRTAAVMVVHYAGRPVAMDDVLALGLPVVEDAAHAVDSWAGDRLCGTLGAVGIWSFDAVKNIATPDGGAVTSAHPAVTEQVRRLRCCGLVGAAHEQDDDGRWWEVEVERPFPRMTPNDVSAAIGLVQLGRLPEHQARRRAIRERYDRELTGLPWLALPPADAPGTRSSDFTYLVRVLDGRRDALARALRVQGIYTTFRYQPLHLTGAFAGAQRGPLPASERLAEEGLNLPLHPALSDADVDRVVAALRAW